MSLLSACMITLINLLMIDQILERLGFHFYTINQIPSHFNFSGIFVGIKNNESVSIIFSDDIRKELKHSPTFDRYAFVNLGIIDITNNLFKNLLSKINTTYIYSFISEMIQNEQFSVIHFDDIGYNATNNKCLIHLRFPTFDSTIDSSIPGYRFMEAVGVEDYVLPDYSNFYNINRGYVLWDGHRSYFRDWFADNMGKENIIKTIKWYDKRMQDESLLRGKVIRARVNKRAS